MTVAQRDEWIQERLPDLWWPYQASKIVRISAEDYNNRLGRQVRCIQSINANARQAYDTVGRFT